MINELSEEQYEEIKRLSEKHYNERSAFMNRIINADLALIAITVSIAALANDQMRSEQHGRFLLLTLVPLLLSAVCLLVTDYYKNPVTWRRALLNYMMALQKDPLDARIRIARPKWSDWTEPLGYAFFAIALIVLLVYSYLVLF